MFSVHQLAACNRHRWWQSVAPHKSVWWFRHLSPAKHGFALLANAMLLRLTEEEHHRQIYGKCFLKHLVWYDSFTWNNWEKTRRLECTKSWYILCIFLHCCQVLIDVLLVFNCTGFPKHGHGKSPYGYNSSPWTWGHFWAWHILFQHVYHNLWKSYIWKSIHLQKIRLFRSCGLKPCGCFYCQRRRGAKWLSMSSLVFGPFIWNSLEIYVCQKMGHFSPIFLGANTSLTKIFEANTIYSQCFGTSTPLQIPFFVENSTLSINVINPVRWRFWSASPQTIFGNRRPREKTH